MVIGYMAERFENDEAAGNAIYRAGSLLFKAKKVDLVKRVFEQFDAHFAKHPKAAQALFVLAEMERDAGNEDEAKRLYEEIAKRYPGDVNYLKSISRSASEYFKASNWPKAIEKYQQYVAAAVPGYFKSDAEWRLGYSLLQTSTPEEGHAILVTLRKNLEADGGAGIHVQGAPEPGGLP